MVEASESTNFGTAPCKPGAGAAPPSPGTSEHPIPAGGFFHERMHPEDPNYHLIRQLELTTWAEWGWQLDGNFSRHATVAEYIESAAKMLERSFDVLISFRDQAPVSTKCAGLEKFKEVALQTIRATLTSQSQTWGGDIANSAIREFAEKAQTLFDAAKRKLVDSELLKRSEPSSVSESLAVPSEPTGIESKSIAFSRTANRVRPRRTPDLEASRERLALVETLRRELAIIKQEVKGYRTADVLKRKYPKFTLWTLIEDSRLKELIDGEAFTPKAYAENLTLIKFGLTSRETLKKDRRKLRKAGPAVQR